MTPDSELLKYFVERCKCDNFGALTIQTFGYILNPFQTLPNKKIANSKDNLFQVSEDYTISDTN